MINTNDVIKNIEDSVMAIENKYSELLNVGEDLFDILEDFSKIVKVARETTRVANNLRFGLFIKGLSGNKSMADGLNKLGELVDRKDFNFYVLSQLQRVLESYSLLGNYLRGLLLSKIEKTDKDKIKIFVEIEKMIDGLTDFDIMNLLHLLDYLNENNTDERILIDKPWEMQSWCINNKHDYDGIYTSLYKVSNFGLLVSEIGTIPDMSVEDEDYNDSYFGKTYIIDGDIETYRIYIGTASFMFFMEMISDSRSLLLKLFKKQNYI